MNSGKKDAKEKKKGKKGYGERGGITTKLIMGGERQETIL